MADIDSIIQAGASLAAAAAAADTTDRAIFNPLLPAIDHLRSLGLSWDKVAEALTTASVSRSNGAQFTGRRLAQLYFRAGLSGHPRVLPHGRKPRRPADLDATPSTPKLPAAVLPASRPLLADNAKESPMFSSPQFPTDGRAATAMLLKMKAEECKS